MLSRFCRLCLEDRGLAMADLFQSSSTSASLVDRFRCTFNIQIWHEPGVATKVCEECIDSLQSAERFKHGCLVADKTHRQLVRQCVVSLPWIKSEPISPTTAPEPMVYFPASELRFTPSDVVIKTELIDLEEMPQDADATFLETDPALFTPIKRIKKMYNCPRCSQTFKWKAHLHVHITRNHRELGLLCKLCNKGFKLTKDIFQHRKVTHGLNSFPCDECSSIFNRRSHLMRHKVIHKKADSIRDEVHAPLKKKIAVPRAIIYPCEFCPKTFGRLSSLRRHLLIHSRAMNKFKCRSCPLVFAEKGRLIAHSRSAHPKFKRFSCRYCAKAYTRNCRLTSHVLKVHTKKGKKSPGKRCVDS